MKIDFYMIKSKSMLEDKVYIGQTRNINTRMSQHKCLTNKLYHNKLYDYIREMGGWDNMRYMVLDSVDIDKDDKQKIGEVERHYIKLFKSQLNKQIPLRTKKEYCNDNRAKCNGYLKKPKLCNECNKYISARNHARHNRNIHNHA